MLYGATSILCHTTAIRIKQGDPPNTIVLSQSGVTHLKYNKIPKKWDLLY
jgi:hypothetical protein